MIKSQLYKYPLNILIPLVLIAIAAVVVFVVYKMNTIHVNKLPEVPPPVKMHLNTKANFDVNVPVEIMTPDRKNIGLNLNGNSFINIDLANDTITLESLDLKAPDKVPVDNNEISSINIKLNPSYPSTGKLNMRAGYIDLSTDLLITFKLKVPKESLKNADIKMSIPLSGKIDKKAGVIKLSGEATIPPDKLPSPLPVKIQVIATTESSSTSKDDI